MRLSKHHALGNDFLVLLDRTGVHPVAPEVVRAACDRHRGVGADGLIRVTPGLPADGHATALTMHLFNADGGRAEMSGNGITCLVQAALLSGWVRGPVVDVGTDAGLRTVVVQAEAATGQHRMTVAMGKPLIGDDDPQWLDDDVTRAVRVDIGNPHLVLHVPDPEWAVDITERGFRVNASVPGGINVEAITPADRPDALAMQVYERGVGVTEACGTGACAAAAAAHSWGLTGAVVEVDQPGGTAIVEVADEIRLTVTATHVANIDYVPGP